VHLAIGNPATDLCAQLLDVITQQGAISQLVAGYRQLVYHQRAGGIGIWCARIGKSKYGNAYCKKFYSRMTHTSSAIFNRQSWRNVVWPLCAVVATNCFHPCQQSDLADAASVHRYRQCGTSDEYHAPGQQTGTDAACLAPTPADDC